MSFMAARSRTTGLSCSKIAKTDRNTSGEEGFYHAGASRKHFNGTVQVGANDDPENGSKE